MYISCRVLFVFSWQSGLKVAEKQSAVLYDLAEISWSETGNAFEMTSEMTLISESNLACHRGDLPALFKKRLGFLDTNLQEIAVRC